MTNRETDSNRLVSSADRIPEQDRVPWALALAVSWGSMRRRLLRSLVTMLGVVLAVAFLSYMTVTDSIEAALVALNHDAVKELLQKAGVDIFRAGAPDRMMILLVGLSLLTCLVGIINSMLMAVTERIKEIGTLKCLGALDSFIVKTYFIESSIQGLLGTVTGICIGLLVALGIAVKSYGKWVFVEFPAAEVIQAAGIAFMLGAVISVSAAILPAYWAAKKEPVDAMRVEE